MAFFFANSFNYRYTCKSQFSDTLTTYFWIGIGDSDDHFFNIIDPTSINKQGPDIGIQYRSGIYNFLPEQLPFIKNYISFRQKEYKKPIAIELETNLIFYGAEDYHQDYLDKNANGYCHVRLDSYKNVE